MWWLRYKECYWRDLSPELRARIIADSAPNPYDVDAMNEHRVGRRISRYTMREMAREGIIAVPPPDIKVVVRAQVARLTVEVPPVKKEDKPREWSPADGLSSRPDYQDVV